MGIKSALWYGLFLIILLMPFSVIAEKQVEVIEGQELLLYAKSGATASSFSSLSAQRIQAFGGSVRLKSVNKRLATVSLGSRGSSFRIFGESELLSACDRIKSSVVGCEINHVLRTSATPNDSLYSSLSGLVKISAPSAWDISTGSRSIKVAVIDTGVDYSHPDLSANIAVNTAEVPGNSVDDDHNGLIDDYYGYDFASLDSNPADDNAHGTHVAGTIGASGNNAAGITGVNWEVGIVPVKVLSASGSGSTAGVIAGIDYAVSRGVNVINLSLGGPGFSQAFYDSIARARDAGVLVVAAAGNENNNNDGPSPSYPASFNLSNIISVAASTSSDSRASFSNYGVNSVHLAAPGVSILSTIPGATYASYSGTSMACPHVAGAAALVKAANPALNMLQVKDLLLNNVDVVSSLSGLVATSGRLNVGRAVAVATGTTPAPQPVPTTPPTTEPGDGAGTSPGDDDDSDSPAMLDYLGVDSTVKGRKASIVTLALDQDDFELSDVTVSVSCDKKLIGQKTTNDFGEAVFSYRLRSASVKCQAVAIDIDGITTKVRNFRLKAAGVRRK